MNTSPLWQRWIPPPRDLILARAIVLRALGLVYLVAFATLVFQGIGLLGAHGLTPIVDYVREARGGAWQLFVARPSLFWFDASDTMLRVVAWTGLGASLLVLLGLANAPLMFLLWALHLSVVQVGQDWYGFGWETQLLETGFICIFLAPALNPLSRRAPTPLPFILLAWLLMRLMLGSGLIKLRGDPRWRDFTCLRYHYETQPVPSPVSWLLNQAPHWLDALGVAFNHFVELVVPFFLLGTRRVRSIAAALMALFQVTLIISGNLSYLNWLTLVPCLACVDDGVWRRIFPRRAESLPPTTAVWLATSAVAVLFAVLSIAPVMNLLSPEQRMNTSFNRLHLVNTYGAFGSIEKERREIIIEGATARDGEWKPYEFKCKPGDPMRAPCLITPYHYRLDWLMWFAAMGPPDEYPWFTNLLLAMLQGNSDVLALLAHNPFPEAPPRFIRAQLYRYRFTGFGEKGWWRRELIRSYVPPVALPQDD